MFNVIQCTYFPVWHPEVRSWFALQPAWLPQKLQSINVDPLISLGGYALARLYGTLFIAWLELNIVWVLCHVLVSTEGLIERGTCRRAASSKARRWLTAESDECLCFLCVSRVLQTTTDKRCIVVTLLSSVCYDLFGECVRTLSMAINFNSS